jgi:hypothetical protein
MTGLLLATERRCVFKCGVCCAVLCCAVLCCVGMEAAIANLLEPGEKILVGNAGIWGERVADLSARYGGESTPAAQSHSRVRQLGFCL